MGFGSTRAEARQLVSHKAVSVNGVVIRHDGKIVREALYYDVSELHRQLR